MFDQIHILIHTENEYFFYFFEITEYVYHSTFDFRHLMYKICDAYSHHNYNYDLMVFFILVFRVSVFVMLDFDYIYDYSADVD